MTATLVITYAGLRYLDRTAALHSAQVRPAGARLDITCVPNTNRAWELALAGAVDLAEVPLSCLFDGAFAEEFVALPIFLNRRYVSAGENPGEGADKDTVTAWARAATVDAGACDATATFPILSVLALRRSVYARERWLAVDLTDAFVAAKALGERRHRYFGALSVGLPWLMSSLRKIDERFGGDAYPYGLGANLDTLKKFAHLLGSDTSEEAITSRFAPETISHPGLPETSAYVVPLSHA